MSVHLIKTNVCYCDTPDCDSGVGDVVEVSAELIVRFAVTRGWRIGPDGEHFCPECVAKNNRNRGVATLTAM